MRKGFDLMVPVAHTAATFVIPLFNKVIFHMLIFSKRIGFNQIWPVPNISDFIHV